jgi:hypothetical protein
MKTLALFLFAFLAISFQSFTQENQDEHLLDGTSMDYYYQNGTAVHVEFIDGQFNYKWIAGPNKDAEGQEKYRSRKIGEKMYLINFMNDPSSTFVTLVFNFNQNVMYSSALIAPGTDQQQVLFDGGIIEHLKLKEN